MIKLLHVEDDPDIREIARLSLRMSRSFEVTQFPSGESALQQAAHLIPDVMMLDVMMPGMTGQQTLAKMRQFNHLVGVPAIFMTARTRQSEQTELRRLGAAGVITKPFDPLQLAAQIIAILGMSGT